MAVALPHLTSVARVAFALSGDQSDADDLVQETYLRALKHWRTFEQGTDCKRWLSTICRHAFYEARGRQRRMEPTESDELESLASAQIHENALTAGVAGMFDQIDLGPAIMSAIAELNPLFRDVLILSDMEGFTYEEIAGMLEIPVGTVRSRLYRGRRKLQESLLAYAVDAGLADRMTSSPTPK
ncbi:MAG: RNA polymerase sigma factor [Gemmatimonadaceae bacterium]|nr:RNA polymerase sigma factor [Gemmatimonadaceae bacterium]